MLCLSDIKIILLALIPVILLPVCSKKEISQFAESPGGQNPLFIIKPSGPEPFYFELGNDGPALISSPAEAPLYPFIPWTNSRFIVCFLPVRQDDEEVLYAAINRSGILKLRNNGRENAVYFYPGGETARNYTTAAFLNFNKKPAALFTNERYFSAEESPAPDFPLWVLDGDRFNAITVSAINAENSAGWTTNSVILGSDGIWYIRKTRQEKEIGYFRTFDLSVSGQTIYIEQYIEASNPLNADDPSVPPLIAWIVNEAGRLAEKPCTATIISPEFPAGRLFSASPDMETAGSETEFPSELSGYYRPAVQGREAIALLLFPDGRGIYCRSGGADIKDGHFSLPALGTENNGNFVYTGVALLGEGPGCFLIAAWEEQENWNIGAAGFLLLEIDW